MSEDEKKTILKTTKHGKAFEIRLTSSPVVRLGPGRIVPEDQPSSRFEYFIDDVRISRDDFLAAIEMLRAMAMP
jgi:hypothetical protein